MNKTLCVINTFFNYEHIIKCFESIYSDSVDYFILENKSIHSDRIENFFLDKKIIGYLQSQENITHGTVDYFFSNYKDLINQYDYVTITDGDLLINNIELVYEEIKKILDEPNVMVCSVDLSLENLPNLPEAKNWIPIGNIINNMYIQANSGTHLMTFKKQNFFIFLDLKHMMDIFVHKHIKKNNGISAKTLLNKAYHLTWDYYVDGNEYFEWKKKNQWTLNFHNLPKNIKKIL